MTVNSNSKATDHTVLRASGFSCPSCVSKIDKQLSRIPGVRDVQVQFASGRIKVDHDPDAVEVDQLVAAVKKAGYDAVPAAF